MNAFIVSARNLIVMTVLLGGLYPAIVTLLGRAFFPIRSTGSMIQVSGKYEGSELIAQKFTKDIYFWPRPSSIDFGAQASGATNKSATSQDLKDTFLKRRKQLGDKAPNDLLYASGSGLDPHISPEAAQFQKERVRRARKMTEDRINQLISQATEERFLGFMGQPRVNVFKLNQLLDKQMRN